MATYVPAKKNTALIFYASLVSQANTKIMQSNPTIASGDFKVSTDGGALGNLATLPAVTPASSVMVKFSLSASEMNGDNITVVCIDAAGAEWCDLVVNIQTAARQVDDLAYPATSGRSMVVDASGLVDANTVKVGPTGSGTAQTARDLGGQLDAAVTTRMATYIQPTGFLAATFPSGTIANTTNITAATGVDVTQISGDSTAADRLEALMDGVVVAQVNGVASTTSIPADGFTEATNDHFKGRLITFISGALSGQQTSITAYTGGTQTFTVVAMTEAPADNDFFVVH